MSAMGCGRARKVSRPFLVSAHRARSLTRLIQHPQRIHHFLDRLVPLRGGAASNAGAAHALGESVGVARVAARDLRDGDEPLERLCPAVKVVELCRFGERL